MNAEVLRVFLADIKSHPEDDTPRLILADWLEEQAGAEAVHDRGTLLRLQCEAARLHEHDPDAVALRWQGRELISRHEHQWLGDLVGLPLIDARFVRGMLHLTMNGASLLTLPFLEASPMSWSWAESAALMVNYGDLRGVEHSPLLRHFSRLEVCQQGQFSDWNRLLDSDHLTHLTDLTLVHSASGDAQLGDLGRCRVLPRLRRLTLRLGEVSPPQWGRLANVPGLAQLHALGVAWCDIREVGFERLVRSPYLSALESLDVASNRIAGPALGALDRAAFRDTLQRLSLAGNPLGDITSLIGTNLPGLRHLDLAGCRLDDAAVETLARVEWVSDLQSLDLRGASLTESGPGLLTAALPALRSLRLASCGMTPEGLAALARSSASASLQELHLRDNLVGDAGVAELVRGDFPSLRVLNLDAARLTDASLQVLTTWPQLAELWHLSLVGNTFTEAGLRQLAGSVYRSPRTTIRIE